MYAWNRENAEHDNVLFILASAQTWLEQCGLRFDRGLGRRSKTFPPRQWRSALTVRAKVIVMAIVGALTYVSLIAIGVPFAIPLSVIVALES